MKKFVLTASVLLLSLSLSTPFVSVDKPIEKRSFSTNTIKAYTGDGGH
nr:hypothetical protein [Brevibacillus laterosporus]